MKRLRAWIFRLAGLWPNDRRERELADEIDSHLQMHIDDNIRRGMAPDLARRDALLKLGGVESTKQAYRERRSVPVIENLLRDVRFSLRQLRKNPGFTSTAILMLALGMCASVAIFAFVDAALLQPLPYRDPARLVGVYERVPLFPRSTLSYPDYLDWKRLNKVFSSLDAYQPSYVSLSTQAGAQSAPGARVTDGFFRTLSITPVLGRDFYAGEDLLSAPRTVILSYPAWQHRYGGSRDVLGKAVMVNGLPHIIVGVLPREFDFAPAGSAEFWITMHASSECDLRRSCHTLLGIARLKDGISVEASLANLQSIATQLEKQYPGSNQGQGAAVALLSEVIVGDIRPILLVLLSGAVLLLLIGSVDVASLLLVRAESRRREIAVRTALGAGQFRLISQFVTEGLVLVTAGSLLGLLAVHWVMQLLTRLIPEGMLAGMPYLRGLGLNLHVLAFASAIALLAAILFALTPTLRLSLPEMRAGLAEGSRGSAGMTWRRLGSKLVVVELTTAMVLLAGAGLLVKSLHRLLHVANGFEPGHLAMLYLAAPQASYGKDEQAVALARQVVTRMAVLPGVESAGISTRPPVTGNGNTDWIRFVGRPFHGEHNEVNERDISSGYFQTLHSKLLRGRYFTDAEDASKPRVMIINQALARKYFPGEDPIGKRVGDDDLSPKSMREIIGIVEDIREGALDEDIWPTEYLAFNQSPDRMFGIVVRTAQAEQSLPLAMNATIHQIDPAIVTGGGMTMTDRINGSQAAYLHRSSAWLVGGFAGLALLLSVVGLYGVVAYSVSQRTREIGVRMALGAQRGSVYRLILREAGWLIAVGVSMGLLCSIAAATLMRSMLFSVRAWDLPTLAAVATVLGGAALLASYIPARRAAAISPVDALRAE